MSDGSSSGTERANRSVEVLLVEDNPGDVRLVEEAFDEADFEASLQVVTDGADALELLSEARDGSDPLPKLVLLDLNLPRVDGFDVIDAIADDPALAQIPIIVLTSSRDSEDVHRCYDGPANAFVTKPDSPDQFVSLAEAMEAFWLDHVTLPPLSM